MAGADALLVERMSDIDEARLAVAAAKSTGLPVVVSFAFDSGKNNDRTMMGATPEAVATAMVEAGADAVGANCGIGVEQVVPICRRLRAACDLPIWIKPNAGLLKMECPMRLRLISCEVLFREMCDACVHSPHQVDLEFLPKGLHDLGGKPMAAEIQEAVDRTPEGVYQAILLGYG